MLPTNTHATYLLTGEKLLIVFKEIVMVGRRA